MTELIDCSLYRIKIKESPEKTWPAMWFEPNRWFITVGKAANNGRDWATFEEEQISQIEPLQFPKPTKDEPIKGKRYLIEVNKWTYYRWELSICRSSDLFDKVFDRISTERFSVRQYCLLEWDND